MENGTKRITWFISLILILGTIIFSSENSVAQVKTIRFLADQTAPAQKKAIEGAARSFEETYPGMKVEIEYTTWDAVYPKLIAGVAAGVLPDGGMLMDMIAASLPFEGLLLPVDDIIQELGGPDAFTEGSLRIAKYKDRYYTVPEGKHAQVLWYRKDLFQKYGVKVPSTWEELFEAAQKLTLDTDGDGKTDVWGIGIPCGRNGFTNRVYQGLMWSNGGRISDRNFKVILDSPQNMEALDYYKKLFKLSPPGSSEWGYTETMDAFVLGKVAMAPYYGRVIGNIHDRNPKIEPFIAVTPWPKRKEQHSHVSLRGLGVFKSTKNEKEIKEFIKFFYTSGFHTKYLLATPGHAAPVLKKEVNSWWEDPLLQQHKEAVEILIERSRYGGFTSAEPGNPVNPAGARIEGERVMEDLIQKAVIGNMSSGEALKWGAEKIRKISEEVGLKQ